MMWIDVLLPPQTLSFESKKFGISSEIVP